jgi:hypothetical protein
MRSEEEISDEAVSPRTSMPGPEAETKEQMTPRTKTLAIGALVAGALFFMPGCSTVPPYEDPPPAAVVTECQAKIGNMQMAVSVAKIGAALAISENSKYGPSLKIALAAIDAALANAKTQCSTGNIDAWQAALAGFDAAMAKLSLGGETFTASSAGPAEAYEASLAAFSDRVLTQGN